LAIFSIAHSSTKTSLVHIVIFFEPGLSFIIFVNSCIFSILSGNLYFDSSDFGFSTTIGVNFVFVSWLGLLPSDLSIFAFITVISGLYLPHACCIRKSLDVLTIFSKLMDLHLKIWTTTISFFLRSTVSFIKISIFHEISSISTKNHFFFAL
jgi:CBS domain containing-hemolysin-like protein